MTEPGAGGALSFYKMTEQRHGRMGRLAAWSGRCVAHARARAAQLRTRGSGAGACVWVGHASSLARCRLNSSEEHSWHSSNSQLNLIVDLIQNFYINWGKRQDDLELKFEYFYK
jgi:hypothetical protein